MEKFHRYPQDIGVIHLLAQWFMYLSKVEFGWIEKISTNLNDFLQTYALAILIIQMSKLTVVIQWKTDHWTDVKPFISNAWKRQNSSWSFITLIIKTLFDNAWIPKSVKVKEASISSIFVFLNQRQRVSYFRIELSNDS